MSKLKVRGSDETIDVQNIYCIGKNYLEHIREFDTKETRNEIPGEPVIFLKPNSAVETEPGYVRIPVFKGVSISSNLQNEVELVLVIGKDGVNISQSEAINYVYGYAVGIDFTLRDIQSELKAKGLPWTLSKGFLSSAPISLIAKKTDVPEPENLSIILKVNGETKQDANTGEMLFKIRYIIHYISSIFSIKRGDLIFTGTPAGITKLSKGDIIEAHIETVGNLKIKVE